MILMNSTTPLLKMTFLVGEKVLESSNTWLSCRLGMAMAGEPNQSFMASFSNCSLVGGTLNTPISMLLPKWYPCGIKALLPTKLLLSIMVLSNINCCPLTSASPRVTESAMKERSPISINGYETLLAVDISVLLPTLAPKALK